MRTYLAGFIPTKHAPPATPFEPGEIDDGRNPHEARPLEFFSADQIERRVAAALSANEARRLCKPVYNSQKPKRSRRT